MSNLTFTIQSKGLKINCFLGIGMKDKTKTQSGPQKRWRERIMSHDYRMPIVKRDFYLFLIQGCFIHFFQGSASVLCKKKKKKFKLNHCLFHFSRSQKDLAEFAPKD